MGVFSISTWGRSIKHHWGILVLTSLLIWGAGITTIFFLTEPLYEVTGAIRVAPVLRNILTGEANQQAMSDYEGFVRTQAEMVTSSRVVQRVADDLAHKQLGFFRQRQGVRNAKPGWKSKGLEQETGPAGILKRAISNGAITAASAAGTELIKVTMKSTEPQEAKQIVDAFIRNFMAVEVSSSAEGQDQKLSLLENEKSVLERKLQAYHDRRQQLEQEYGTERLNARQQMMLQSMQILQGQLTNLQAKAIELGARVEFLEQAQDRTMTPAPVELLIKRKHYIDSDVRIQVLSKRIADFEIDYAVSKLDVSAENPDIKRRKEVLDVLKSHLENCKKQTGEVFDTMIAEQSAKAHEQSLLKAKEELKQTQMHQKRLREALAEEDSKAIELGRKQLSIEDLESDEKYDREMYDTICRRISEVKMERKRPARVSVAYYADITGMRRGRLNVKYVAVLIPGAILLGMVMAFLREWAAR